MLEPFATGVRIVECASCHRPAEERCVRCGRSLSPPSPSGEALPDSSPYRGAIADSSARLVMFELVRAPSRSAIAEAHREWEQTKPRLAGPHDADTELRATWLAALLASTYVDDGDALRERALLTTALEGVLRPVYRARIVARLARAAVRAGALDLGEEWLALATSTGDLDADSDVAVARALLDHARGRFMHVLERIGTSDSTVSGSARVLADLLRIHAFEAQHDLAHARVLWSRAAPRHGEATVRDLALRFALAPRTRRRLPRAALTTAAVVSAAASAVGWLLSTL